MRAQLANEKKSARQLRAHLLSDQAQKATLEELFLRCVESVQRDIVRRKKKAALNNNSATTTSLKSRPRTPGGGWSASPTPTTEGVKLGPESYQVDLNDSMEFDKAAIAAVAPADFTAADRVHVIERLLGQDEVLSFLYDHLFPPPEDASNSHSKTQPSKWQGMHAMPSSSPLNVPDYKSPHGIANDGFSVNNSFEGGDRVWVRKRGSGTKGGRWDVLSSGD